MNRALRSLRRFNRWDWLLVGIVFWWLAASVVVGALYLHFGVVEAGQSSLLLYSPIIIYMIVSLVTVGISSPHKPLIARDSMLWNWLTLMSRWVNTGALLVAGAFVGALAGASFAGGREPSSQLAGASMFLVVILELWVAIAMVLWTALAVVDIVRLGKQRKANYIQWARARTKKVRHLESKADAVESGSGPISVITAGLALLAAVVLLGQATVYLLADLS